MPSELILIEPNWTNVTSQNPEWLVGDWQTGQLAKLWFMSHQTCPVCLKLWSITLPSLVQKEVAFLTVWKPGMYSLTGIWESQIPVFTLPWKLIRWPYFQPNLLQGYLGDKTEMRTCWVPIGEKVINEWKKTQQTLAILWFLSVSNTVCGLTSTALSM